MGRGRNAGIMVGDGGAGGGRPLLGFAMKRTVQLVAEATLLCMCWAQRQSLYAWCIIKQFVQNQASLTVTVVVVELGRDVEERRNSQDRSCGFDGCAGTL